jgi:hypothetical protein
MFGFHRKKKPSTGTADTFVEATGGGWFDAPDRVAGDGGSQADFVGVTLERARNYALENDIPVGKEFEFTITEIPLGISSPHDIIFGLMMRAQEYGLSSNAVANETAFFTRLE